MSLMKLETQQTLPSFKKMWWMGIARHNVVTQYSSKCWSRYFQGIQGEMEDPNTLTGDEEEPWQENYQEELTVRINVEDVILKY